MAGTVDEMLPDRGPGAAQQALRAAAEVRVWDGRATAWLVGARLVEVLGAVLFFGGIFYGSVLVGQWVWVAVGLAVLLFAYEGPVGRRAGAEPRRWPNRWRAALVTTAIVVILLESAGLLGTWASSGRFGSTVVVGPAVVAVCYLLAPVVRWAWSRRRPRGTTPWPDGAQAYAVLAVLSQVQWMHPDRLAGLAGLSSGRCDEWVRACAARGLAVPATYRRFFRPNVEITAAGLARLDAWTAELTERAAGDVGEVGAVADTAGTSVP